MWNSHLRVYTRFIESDIWFKLRKESNHCLDVDSELITHWTEEKVQLVWRIVPFFRSFSSYIEQGSDQ